MPETGNELNAWNYFRNTDYETFIKTCLSNPNNYGVIRFKDEEINEKLTHYSEFIEIYHKDDKRTPCVVIDTQTKISGIENNDMPTTETHNYLYRDSNFLEKFGSLKQLAYFDCTADSFRTDIINGCYGLNTTNESHQDFDIRNEQYRELKKLLLSDPFCIDLVNMNHDSPRHLYEDGDNIYYDTMVNKYYTPKFRIIERDTMHSKNKNQYLKILSPDSIFLKTSDVINPKNQVDFMPLLVCQSVLINRLVHWLKNIQCAWTDKDKQRLWALRGIEKGSK